MDVAQKPSFRFGLVFGLVAGLPSYLLAVAVLTALEFPNPVLILIVGVVVVVFLGLALLMYQYLTSPEPAPGGVRGEGSGKGDGPVPPRQTVPGRFFLGLGVGLLLSVSFLGLLVFRPVP